MYSCTSLGVKLGGGLGTAITGWLLAASHFDSALAVQPGFLYQYAEDHVSGDSVCSGCHHHLHSLSYEGRRSK